MATHDVRRAARRRELHKEAASAGVPNPASLTLGLEALEVESGWATSRVRVEDGAVVVELAKAVRPLSRQELVERVCGERGQGLSYRQIGRRLEIDGIAAPHGGARWHASSVRWVATNIG